MKSRPRHITIAALATIVLFPAGASATQLHGDHSRSPGAYICGTNYSMNSVDGKYCAPRHATPIASLPPASAAALRSEQTSAVVRPNADEQTPARTGVTIVRVSTPTSGFDWGDASIGAAAGLALSMLALGLVLVVSQHRARRSSRSAATAS